MAKSDFISQLQDLGFNPQEPAPDKVYFEYTVPVGRNIGKKILMGFIVGNDFPMNCPTGPHILALDPGWIEHPQNIHNQNFGVNLPAGLQQNWRYWSRPCPSWGTERTVRYYLAHIKNIFMTI